VKITRRVAAQAELILDLVWPGQPFGEDAIPGMRRRLTAARALVPSKLLQLTRDELDRAVRASPSLASELLSRMALRQGALFERMAELTWAAPSDRIASARERLRDLVARCGRAEDDVAEADVAAHAWTSRRAVRTHVVGRAPAAADPGDHAARSAPRPVGLEAATPGRAVSFRPTPPARNR
jgi:CRP-like cAMP-binding protein